MKQFAKMLRGLAAMLILIAALAAGSVQSVLAAGTRVNTTITGDQYQPSIAVNASGKSVITWTHDGRSGGNGRVDIYAQRYDSNGQPLGSEFQVNDPNKNTGGVYSRVAIDDAGNFVVVWEGDDRDGMSFGICVQRYNSTGQKDGDQFWANTYVKSNQLTPDVAMNESGNFIITWTSAFQDSGNPSENDYYNVYAQLYSADGQPVGQEFRVNTYTGGGQVGSRAAMDALGNFLITWSSNDGQDGDGGSVYAQRYNSSATPLGSEFRVNTTTTWDQGEPVVTMNASGQSVITWTSSRRESQDDASKIIASIHGQRYGTDGQPLGQEFQVSGDATEHQRNSSVAIDAFGNFAVAWRVPNKNSGVNIYGRWYHNSDSTPGSDFAFEATDYNPQGFWGVAVDGPAAAMDASGNLIITWAGRFLGYNDGSLEIYANRFSSPAPTPTPTPKPTRPPLAPRSIRVDAAGGYGLLDGEVEYITASPLYGKITPVTETTDVFNGTRRLNIWLEVTGVTKTNGAALVDTGGNSVGEFLARRGLIAPSASPSYNATFANIDAAVTFSVAFTPAAARLNITELVLLATGVPITPDDVARTWGDFKTLSPIYNASQRFVGLDPANKIDTTRRIVLAASDLKDLTTPEQVEALSLIIKKRYGKDLTRSEFLKGFKRVLNAKSLLENLGDVIVLGAAAKGDLLTVRFYASPIKERR